MATSKCDRKECQAGRKWFSKLQVELLKGLVPQVAVSLYQVKRLLE